MYTYVVHCTHVHNICKKVLLLLHRPSNPISALLKVEQEEGKGNRERDNRLQIFYKEEREEGDTAHVQYVLVHFWKFPPSGLEVLGYVCGVCGENYKENERLTAAAAVAALEEEEEEGEMTAESSQQRMRGGGMRQQSKKNFYRHQAEEGPQG